MYTTIASPQVKVDAAIKKLLQTQTENCTIVHCTYRSPEENLLAIRIWLSTFLIEDFGRKCKLIKAFNISLHPHWTCHYSNEAKFTLVFEGLSKSCRSFHVFEDIPEPGGFFSDIIARNSTDVYNTDIQC